MKGPFTYRVSVPLMPIYHTRFLAIEATTARFTHCKIGTVSSRWANFCHQIPLIDALVLRTIEQDYLVPFIEAHTPARYPSTLAFTYPTTGRKRVNAWFKHRSHAAMFKLFHCQLLEALQ